MPLIIFLLCLLKVKKDSGRTLLNHQSTFICPRAAIIATYYRLMNTSTEGPLNSTSAACSGTVSAMFTTSLTAISAAAFVGNILVATTFIKTPSLRTNINYCIVNMAVSDLLSPFFNWPLYASEGMLTTNIFINQPSAGFVCKIAMYLRTVSQTVSVLSLVLIAFDRFIAIVFPLGKFG